MLDASTRSEKCVLEPQFYWIFSILAAMFSGCSMFELEPSPTVIELKINTSRDLNLTREGTAAPIVARVYELKASDGFSNADFFAIYDHDKDILGGDLVFREELELTPDETRQIKLEPKPESRFIGVFGAFRDLEKSQWRAVKAITPNQTMVMRVHFSRNSVAIETAPEEPPVEENPRSE